MQMFQNHRRGISHHDKPKPCLECAEKMEVDGYHGMCDKAYRHYDRAEKAREEMHRHNADAYRLEQEQKKNGK